MKSDTIRGVAMVLAAAMLWGTTGTAQSFAPPDLAPYWVGALRLLAAAAFFAVWLAFTRPRVLAPHRIAALPWGGILAAALCMSAYNLAFFAGVRASGVAIGTAIALGSGPVWAGLLQTLHGGRRPAPAWWAGTGLAVAGGALMIVGPGAVVPDLRGIASCLFAGLCYASFALVNKRMVAQAPAGSVTGAVFTLAALFALPTAAAIAGTPRLAPADLPVIAWLGVMSTGIAYLLFANALRHVSGATGVALALGEPLTAFTLAVLIVGERPGPSALLGLLAVLGGLALVIRAELRGAADPAV